MANQNTFPLEEDVELLSHLCLLKIGTIKPEVVNNRKRVVRESLVISHKYIAEAGPQDMITMMAVVETYTEVLVTAIVSLAAGVVEDLPIKVSEDIKDQIRLNIADNIRSVLVDQLRSLITSSHVEITKFMDKNQENL